MAGCHCRETYLAGEDDPLDGFELKLAADEDPGAEDA